MPKPIDVKFTKEGFEKLKVEFQGLLDRRPGVLARLVAAREQGDLSENAGYHASKEELGRIDRRIRELKLLIRLGDVVDSTSGEIVSIGNLVKVQTGEDVAEFTIVGRLEADPARNRLSEVSPIGSALIGKKVGDDVEITIPQGKIVYKILSIK